MTRRQIIGPSVSDQQGGMVSFPRGQCRRAALPARQLQIATPVLVSTGDDDNSGLGGVWCLADDSQVHFILSYNAMHLAF